MAGMDTGWAACSRCDHNLVQHLFCRRLGWHGAGHAWDSCDSRSVCRVLDRDGVPAVEKANQEKVRHLPSQMMSNFLRAGRNFLSSGEIHITLQ